MSVLKLHWISISFSLTSIFLSIANELKLKRPSFQVYSHFDHPMPRSFVRRKISSQKDNEVNTDALLKDGFETKYTLSSNNLNDYSGPIFDLSPLLRCLVHSRPSKNIKSPYVADVIVTEQLSCTQSITVQFVVDDRDETSSPAKKRNAKRASPLIHETPPNDSKICTNDTSEHMLAHAPSLDCAGMVVSGSYVYCSQNTNGNTKTAYTIQLSEELRETGKYEIVG